MTEIKERLIALQDGAYADFQFKLIPTIERESIIGVRVPELRKLAKTLYKEETYLEFLGRAPHDYYDENMLHSLILSEIKDYDSCIREVEVFLPYVDNWAVCDILSPKVFKKHRGDLPSKIKLWLASNHIYTCRFGLGMLMQHFLDEDFDKEFLELAASVHSEEYYVNMMQAWYFATALAKQWEETITIIEGAKLQPWVHNKTIQKAIESYRISPEQKNYLRTLKRRS